MDAGAAIILPFLKLLFIFLPWQTGQYSTQIFSLAVLLSSLFVFNQMVSGVLVV